MATCGGALIRCTLVLSAVLVSTSHILIDPDQRSRQYDGHGGLSAGASSRLLFDYPEPHRSDILDYLWKPSFGASLAICKVEIGGDVQSTDGSEPSHMHTSKDENYSRGYEWWLLSEAKKRNPLIKSYALSWGTPGWVGNGSYFSDDNIRYQTSWVKGARDAWNVTVDYIGVWNERSWGNVQYIKELRAALNAAGFESTKIVGSDGGIPADQIKALSTDPVFAAAEHIQGTHYPCARAQPAGFWEIQPTQTYWSDEDFSTIGGDWAGAGCWGRSLLQNWVKLNATATISWSTIWSVYDSWRYFGNGLMYAYQPWSGNYTVPPAVWTSAHVTQFAQPGWQYLTGTGSGMLPGGGSWTAMVPPSSTRAPRSGGRSTVSGAGAADFSLVLEKLEGDCLRCKVGPTTDEVVSFQLAGALLGVETLAMWLTNSSASFERQSDVHVDSSGVFSLLAPRDHMITLTTTTGQTKGQAGTCSGDTICSGTYEPFPFPYNQTYDHDQAGAASGMAPYHADNAGAFELRGDPTGSGQHLLQASPRYPKATSWVLDYDPITSLGSTDWANLAASADVMLMPPVPAYARDDTLVPLPTASGVLTDWSSDPISMGVYAGVCVRQVDQSASGFCLLVGVNLCIGQGEFLNGTGWVLQAGAMHLQRATGTVLAFGSVELGLQQYHSVELGVQGQRLRASLDGAVLADLPNTQSQIPPVGLVALRSSFTYTQFDNLQIKPFSESIPAASSEMFFDKHLLWPPLRSPGGPQDPALPLATADGLFGCAFTVGASPVVVDAVARFGAGFKASETHVIMIIEASSNTTVAQATVDLSNGTMADLFGWVWADLAHPLTLRNGTKYFLVSSERTGGDTVYDSKVIVQARSGLLIGYPTPTYHDRLGWHHADDVRVHTVISKATHECWDTRDSSTLDTWSCVTDGHNELFNYSAATGMIVTGTKDQGGGGTCVTARKATAAQLPATSLLSECDSANPLQQFTYESRDLSLRLRSDHTMCLSSGPVGLNAAVLLQSCSSPVSASQQWQFGSFEPQPAEVRSEWGNSFGPLNLRTAA
eukprot:TRINITY_DN2455_c0_g4_i1.p1 TRINITY_DN2455_c0_g4~~TRINITY_DN2455_c0_g4_i1.p1  ORF type:complete len:1051 (-),score=162.84 TRINITY_DN2455_c0_g4_i1:218-3370(-)